MVEKLRTIQEGVPKKIEEKFDTVRKKFDCGREQIEVFKKPAGYPDSRVVIAIKRSSSEQKGVWDIEFNLNWIGKSSTGVEENNP